MTEPSHTGIEFLDTFVTFENGILHTSPWSKACDSHTYLLPSSCHPTHTLKNIPYNIAHRIFKISSNNEIYEAAKREYSEYLHNRGYSNDIIDASFKKAELLNRSDLITGKSKQKLESKKCIPLVCDFNPGLPPVGKFINKYKYILELDDELVKIINPNHIFVSYRGNKTIKDMLVPSQLRNNQPPQPTQPPPCIPNNVGSVACEKQCKLCSLFLDSPQMIWSYHTEQTFNFRYKLSCKSRNVIYKIDDIVCKKSYIGSTVTGMSGRWNNHKSHIRKSVPSCELTSHFCTKSNGAHQFDKTCKIPEFDEILSKILKVTLIDQVEMDTGTSNAEILKKCKEREAYWQNQLKTLTTSGGFNKRDARKETKSYSSRTKTT